MIMIIKSEEIQRKCINCITWISAPIYFYCKKLHLIWSSKITNFDFGSISVTRWAFLVLHQNFIGVHLPSTKHQRHCQKRCIPASAKNNRDQRMGDPESWSIMHPSSLNNASREKLVTTASFISVTCCIPLKCSLLKSPLSNNDISTCKKTTT